MYVMFILDKVVNGFLMTAVTGIFLFVFDWQIALAAAAVLAPSVVMFVVLQKSGKRWEVSDRTPRRNWVQLYWNTPKGL